MKAYKPRGQFQQWVYDALENLSEKLSDIQKYNAMQNGKLLDHEKRIRENEKRVAVLFVKIAGISAGIALLITYATKALVK